MKNDEVDYDLTLCTWGVSALNLASAKNEANTRRHRDCISGRFATQDPETGMSLCVYLEYVRGVIV